MWKREGWKGAVGKKGKGKARARRFGAESSEDEHYEAYQNDDGDAGDPIVDGDDELDLDAPPPPMTLVPDVEAMKTWIYPLNKPLRDYQVRAAR